MKAWSRSDVIGCLSLLVAVIACAAAVVVVPEVRSYLGLDRPLNSSNFDSARSSHENVTPMKEKKAGAELSLSTKDRQNFQAEGIERKKVVSSLGEPIVFSVKLRRNGPSFGRLAELLISGKNFGSGRGKVFEVIGRQGVVTRKSELELIIWSDAQIVANLTIDPAEWEGLTGRFISITTFDFRSSKPTRITPKDDD